MRLAAESHARLQDFFRQHYDQASLSLPVINWRRDALAHGVTRLNRITAITLGRTVLVTPEAIWQDTNGSWRTSSRLAAHEATHVLQYEKQGWGRFLYGYVSEYAAAMRQATQWNKATHFQSYANLSAEREAQELEYAYYAWCGRETEEMLDC